MPAQHPGVNALDDFVPHLGVRLVAPPEQHVGRFEHAGAEAMLRLVQGRRAYVEPRRAQRRGQRLMDAVRIDRADLGVGPLVAELVPTVTRGDRFMAVLRA